MVFLGSQGIPSREMDDEVMDETTEEDRRVLP